MTERRIVRAHRPLRELTDDELEFIDMAASTDTATPDALKPAADRLLDLVEEEREHR